MRIIDCLNDQEEGDRIMESKRKKAVFDLESIKRLISRLFLTISCKNCMNKRKDKMKKVGFDSDLESNERTNLDEGRMSSDIPADSERNVSSFYFGMGVGLALLLLQNATGIREMVDLKTQMETLLRDIKQEVQRRDDTGGFSISEDNISLAASHCGETTSKANLPKPGGVECIGELNYEANDENSIGLTMNEMETELEAELERLQCNLDGNSLSLLQCGGDEVDCENTYSSDNYNEEEIALRNEIQERNGVCAHELERKLHELLETRQEERILELESALLDSQKKFYEMEMELNLRRNAE